VRQARVRRFRLVQQLDSSGPWRLTLLSAPVGWGKTTLLADWYEQRSGPRDAWLSLDVGDNDPTRFWTGVVAGPCPRTWRRAVIRVDDRRSRRCPPR
jgi:LuxR family maltose regulon positive regulatory protein